MAHKLTECGYRVLSESKALTLGGDTSSKSSGWGVISARRLTAMGYRAGGRITLGSDFPVESIDPLKGFYAAVTRLNEDGNSPMGKYGW
jgi:hypothetical protein